MNAAWDSKGGQGEQRPLDNAEELKSDLQEFVHFTGDISGNMWYNRIVP